MMLNWHVSSNRLRIYSIGYTLYLSPVITWLFYYIVNPAKEKEGWMGDSNVGSTESVCIFCNIRPILPLITFAA